MVTSPRRFTPPRPSQQAPQAPLREEPRHRSPSPRPPLLHQAAAPRRRAGAPWRAVVAARRTGRARRVAAPDSRVVRSSQSAVSSKQYVVSSKQSVVSSQYSAGSGSKCACCSIITVMLCSSSSTCCCEDARASWLAETISAISSDARPLLACKCKCVRAEASEPRQRVPRASA